MGNNASAPQRLNEGQPVAVGGHHQSQKPKEDDSLPRRDSKRREGSHAAPTKATVAPPAASLESATGHPAASSPRDIVKSARPRSSTNPSPAPLPRQLETTMGNEPSKPARDVSRSSSVREKSTSRQATSKDGTSASQPIDTPASSRADKATYTTSPLNPSAPPADPYIMPSSFSRPPRLPLPIEEELHTPGSPILSPSVPLTSDASVPEIDIKGLGEDLARRGSIISSTVDDEEEPDEFRGYMPDVGPNVAKVPTMIEWRDASPEDKVYVTGTFMNWEKKYRLHWNGPSKHANALSATLQLPPGTHHLRFLVNNEMTLSPHLPTTVDFTNFLVNYIEVVQAPTQPIAVPATAISKPLDIRPKQATDVGTAARVASPVTKGIAPGTSSPSSGQARASPKPSKPSMVPTRASPPKVYTRQIPQYLVDLDQYPPASADSPESSPDIHSAASRYQRANLAANALPAPPSLPLFLSKSILNTATPTKDDASVLVLPNHTVINHLASTNVRNGILAVSATTRYKKRFLTTILFKPRSEA